MTAWTISPEALAAWARDVLKKYSKDDIDLFIIRLRRVGTS